MATQSDHDHTHWAHPDTRADVPPEVWGYAACVSLAPGQAGFAYSHLRSTAAPCRIGKPHSVTTASEPRAGIEPGMRGAGGTRTRDFTALQAAPMAALAQRHGCVS